MSIPLIIGLTGTRGVGKDTLFSHLAAINPKCTRMAFADRLKDDLSSFIYTQWGFKLSSLSPEQKEIVRHLFIGYGMAWRAADPLHWVKCVAEYIDLLPDDDLIPVITDFRFVNEVEFFRERYGAYFRLINITRKGAPSPTGEEEKHFRQVAEMADYRLYWGGEDVLQQRTRAQEVLRGLDIK